MNILGDEVELDTHLWELVHMAILALLIETELLLVIRGFILDLDVAVILNTTANSGTNGRGTLDLAETVGRRERVRQGHEQVIDVRRAAEASGAGLLGQRDLEAVHVPVKAAVGARDDGSIRGGGREVALMAKDGLALGIFETEVVRCLLVTRAPRRMSMNTWKETTQ